MKPTNQQINEAVKLLLEVTDNAVVLKQNEEASVYILPALLDRDSTDVPSRVGKIEYQVSDGLEGQRSTSADFYNYYDALKFYKAVEKRGWQSAMRDPPKKKRKSQLKIGWLNHPL